MTAFQQQVVDTSDSDRAEGGVSVDGPAEADGPAGASLKVFINYRHEDTQITAWLLYARLKDQFGAQNVFFDQGTLRPGMQWFAEITSHVAGARAFIALIGPKWMPSLTAHQQRGSDDYVAKETDLALRSGPGVTVIPVLVEDAEPPDPGELPPSLRALPACQAERLRNSHLPDDIEHLIARLGEMARIPPPAAVPRPVPVPRPAGVPRPVPVPRPAAASRLRTTTTTGWWSGMPATWWCFSARTLTAMTAMSHGGRALGRSPTTRTWRGISPPTWSWATRRCIWRRSRSMRAPSRVNPSCSSWSTGFFGSTRSRARCTGTSRAFPHDSGTVTR